MVLRCRSIQPRLLVEAHRIFLLLVDTVLELLGLLKLIHASLVLRTTFTLLLVLLVPLLTIRPRCEIHLLRLTTNNAAKATLLL